MVMIHYEFDTCVEDWHVFIHKLRWWMCFIKRKYANPCSTFNCIEFIYSHLSLYFFRSALNCDLMRVAISPFWNSHESWHLICLSLILVYWTLIHWGRVMHICISKLTIIGSDKGLSLGWRQAIIWTNAGIFLIRTLGTNYGEISSGIHTFSFKKIYLKMSSVKWREFVWASVW